MSYLLEKLNLWSVAEEIEADEAVKKQRHLVHRQIEKSNMKLKKVIETSDPILIPPKKIRKNKK